MAAQQEKPAPAATRTGGRRTFNPGLLVLRITSNFGIGLPFFVVGLYGLIYAELPEQAALVIILVGFLVVLVGFYVSVLSAPKLTLLAGENELVMRHPSMKPAVARMALSLPFFATAVYLLDYTSLPYVYPFVPFLIGLFMYFRGMVTYWMNHHTVYYVTNRRAARIYRFLWLDTTEIPVNAINSISETRSFIELITGRGSVVVASGIGARHNVKMQEIGDPGPVALALRQMMP